MHDWDLSIGDAGEVLAAHKHDGETVPAEVRVEEGGAIWATCISCDASVPIERDEGGASGADAWRIPR